jgi:GNAT superfamily N-acetyltransferase
MLDPEDPVVADRWAEMLADDSLDIVGVEHDGRLVASCVLSVTTNLIRGARPWAVVENVVTHEDYRGRGCGTECIEDAADRARERDCYKVMLLTGSDEAWKHEFYESCGFDPDGQTDPP